jgi:hypothetical protein
MTDIETWKHWMISTRNRAQMMSKELAAQQSLSALFSQRALKTAKKAAFSGQNRGLSENKNCAFGAIFNPMKEEH